MTTSWNELIQNERFLFGKLSTQDALVHEARMLTDPVFRIDVAAQKKTYSIVKLYSRKQLKEELEVVHEKIFSDPAQASFCQRILNYFRPH